MQIIKGMVQVRGTTYRVVRLQVGRYQVIRIVDDAVAGTFVCGRMLEITARSVDVALMRQIAAAAVQQGKTSWMGHSAASPLRTHRA
jgi:hypothetical protein